MKNALEIQLDYGVKSNKIKNEFAHEKCEAREKAKRNSIKWLICERKWFNFHMLSWVMISLHWSDKHITICIKNVWSFDTACCMGKCTYVRTVCTDGGVWFPISFVRREKRNKTQNICISTFWTHCDIECWKSPNEKLIRLKIEVNSAVGQGVFNLN